MPARGPVENRLSSSVRKRRFKPFKSFQFFVQGSGFSLVFRVLPPKPEVERVLKRKRGERAYLIIIHGFKKGGGGVCYTVCGRSICTFPTEDVVD